MMGGNTRLAVLGSPIAHSMSPALHSAAYRVLGLDWEYSRVEVTGEGLSGFVAGLDESWLGLSLTMPLKHAILPLLTAMDATASLTGAANTVYFDRTPGRDAAVHGFNTDVGGIVRALNAAGLHTARQIQILGGGATASSALAAAARLDARTVTVFTRSPERAAPLVGFGERLGVQVRIRDFTHADPGTAQTPDLVLSTLPGGVDSGIRFDERSRAHAVLLDAAYDPWPSRLALSWQRAGGHVVSGLAMLVHQALLQVRVFVAGDPEQPLPGEDAVLAAMLDAVAMGES